MRRHLRALRIDRRIDVDHSPTRGGKTSPYLTQKHPAICAAIARIGIREKPSDVAHARCAQQGVNDRMQQHVGIGVPQQTQFVRNLDATDNQLASRHQGMNIATLPNANRCASAHLFLAASNNSANSRSAGYVTLKLVASARTSSGCSPIASIALASSVTACRAPSA